MMKMSFPAIIIIVSFISCTNSTTNKESPISRKDPDSSQKVISKPNFFPVTAYINGQLYEIRSKGINPKQYTTVKDQTDSVWLKIEELPRAMKEFLEPEIDSVNLISLFTEKKFLDQTLNAITLSYDPIDQLPDSMKLNHWDVYVDPKSGNVRRIYMVKNISADKILQLTWITDNWCKLTTIINYPDGSSAIEKEVKISWHF